MWVKNHMANAYRTIVYVDGLNFYYGEVRGTPWKWLNPESLFREILRPQNKLIRIKYFTARVAPTSRDPHVNLRQDAYLRALEVYCPLLELYYGHFLRHAISMENAHPPPERVEVWRNEEKGSDVNLALHVLNDAWRDAYDCAVIVSNDSDLAESLRLVRQERHKIIGLIAPGANSRKKQDRRETSKELKQYADFTRPIYAWMLEKSQLPDSIPGTNIHKPTDW